MTKRKYIVTIRRKWPAPLSIVNSKNWRYFRITKESKYLYSDLLPYLYLGEKSKDKMLLSFIDRLEEIDKKSKTPIEFFKMIKGALDDFNKNMEEFYGRKLLNVRLEKDYSVSSKKHKIKNFTIIRKIFWRQFREFLNEYATDEAYSLSDKYYYLMECNYGLLYDKLMMRDNIKSNYIKGTVNTIKPFLKPHLNEISKKLSSLDLMQKLLIKKSYIKNPYTSVKYAIGLKFQLESLKRDVNNYDFVSSYAKLRSILITICKLQLALLGKNKFLGNEDMKIHDFDITKNATIGINEFVKLKNDFQEVINTHNPKRKYNKTADYLYVRFYETYSNGFVHQNAYVIPGLSLFEALIFKNEITKFTEAITILSKSLNNYG